MATPGDVIAEKYVVDDVIASGGMGVVYRATQLPLQRRVAIKLLRPELQDSSVIRGRFRREAIAAARVVHRNVIAILDYHEVKSETCLVMPYVRGLRLGEARVRCGAWSLQRILGVFDQLLAALAATHALGIVHGDVKSDNVLRSEDGDGEHVTLIDFGLARLPDEPCDRTSGISGTPEYLAPEVIEGHEPTSASDVYSAGIIIYELLAGVTPFSGGDACIVLARHLDEPVPSLRDRCSHTSIPEALERVVMRALEKDPQLRFDRVTAFRDALNAIRLAAPPVAPDDAPVTYDPDGITLEMLAPPHRRPGASRRSTRGAAAR